MLGWLRFTKHNSYLSLHKKLIDLSQGASELDWFESSAQRFLSPLENVASDGMPESPGGDGRIHGVGEARDGLSWTNPLPTWKFQYPDKTRLPLRPFAKCAPHFDSKPRVLPTMALGDASACSRTDPDPHQILGGWRGDSQGSGSLHRRVALWNVSPNVDAHWRTLRQLEFYHSILH